MLAATLALTGVVGFAQQQSTQGQDNGQARQGREGRGGRRGFDGERDGLFGGRFGENLNLTDAQKEQLRQISVRYREVFKAQRQQNRGERRGGFDALKGGTFDEAAVRAAAQARANAQVEMEVQRAHMMFEMYNVLTSEQKAQLAAERQQREQQREQRRQERRTRRQAEGVSQN